MYVINLDSSSKAMPLGVPFRHELVGFSVFRSRVIEDGRERFRLHLGYFESKERADEALSVIRKYYPAAWTSPAPATNLGSLDDTTNTEFRLVHSAYARVAEPEDWFIPPAPIAAKVTASAVVIEPAATAAKPVKPAIPADSAVSQTQQRYAVQLDWSVTPIIAADIPRLAIFSAYYLYTVRVVRDGLPQQGLRLGFFSSPDAAGQVAAAHTARKIVCVRHAAPFRITVRLGVI